MTATSIPPRPLIPVRLRRTIGVAPFSLEPGERVGLDRLAPVPVWVGEVWSRRDSKVRYFTVSSVSLRAVTCLMLFASLRRRRD